MKRRQCFLVMDLIAKMQREIVISSVVAVFHIFLIYPSAYFKSICYKSILVILILANRTLKFQEK